jgi:hypothetical protein
MRRLNSIIILAAVAVVAFAVPASADTSQWPAFLKGSVTGSRYDFNAEIPAGQYFMDFCAPVSSCPMPNPGTPSSSSTDRWQIPNLKLKRERVKVMRSQIQVVYKIVGGTVTWSHESTHCPPFTETFALTIAKWDIDSRITFFAPKTGRYKNRWRMDGLIDSMHQGPCMQTAGSLASGEVGMTPPIARPGKTVRLGHDTHHVKNDPLTGYGGFTDSKGMLTIRVPRL